MELVQMFPEPYLSSNAESLLKLKAFFPKFAIPNGSRIYKIEWTIYILTWKHNSKCGLVFKMRLKVIPTVL